MNTETSLIPSQPRPSGELAVAASAAHAKALVEAQFTIALHRPRNVMQARDKILEACRRPAFAERAWYAKPVGGGKVRGPSIRFAEMAIQAMTNISVKPSILHEDEDKIILEVSVLDLECNVGYSDTVVISKTIERKNSKDREVLRERVNTSGEKVFIVRATDDELMNKMASAKSKIIRNSGLRLVPQDLIEDAETEIAKTLDGGTEDRTQKVKKIADAFSDMGVKPADLEQYLGHALASVSGTELLDLRGIYSAIKDGEAKWSDYVQGPSRAEPAGGKFKGKAKAAETPAPAATEDNWDAEPKEEVK